MGLVYLPIHCTIKKSTIHVGKYTSPVDGMASFFKQKPLAAGRGSWKNFQPRRSWCCKIRIGSSAREVHKREPLPPKQRAPKKGWGNFWHCAVLCKEVLAVCFFSVFFVFPVIFLFFLVFFLLSASVSSDQMKDRTLTAKDGRAAFVFVGREGRGWIYSPGKYHISHQTPKGKSSTQKWQTGGDMFVPWRVDIFVVSIKFLLWILTLM